MKNSNRSDWIKGKKKVKKKKKKVKTKVVMTKWDDVEPDINAEVRGYRGCGSSGC